MANDNTQDVELRIRATNYSKKTTTEVTAALKDLVKAEEAQIEAAKKGAASAADLEKGYTKIESAVKALLGQSSLVKLFQSQTAALDDLKAKLEASRKAQADYAASIAPGERMTAAQTAAFNKLGREAANVEKQIARMEGRITTTTTNLKQFGIDSTNAASKQTEITTAVTTANAALARQEAAMEGADGFAKQARDARLATDATERVANARMIANEAARQATVALAAQARAEQEVAAAAAMRNVQHEADMEALFTREATKRTDALKLQAVAMRAAADAAERQIRTSDVTARGTTPAVTAPTIAQRLGSIADPSSDAIKTVQELDAAISGLTARVAAIDGPVADYRASLQAAEQAQRSLAAMGGLIDSYQRQVVAVRAARTEYVAARTAVSELVAQMRAGATGDDITTRLARAQSTLERAGVALGTVTTQARTTQAALAQAGISTNDLAGAEAQLIGQANRAAGAMNGLTDAYRRNGAAANGAGQSMFNWFGGDGGRTTLSYAQRLRGEVLSLAAGFVGLQASIGLAQKTIEAYNLTQATMNRLLVASGGDTELARSEFDYLHEASDRIGVSFTKVAPAYAKLAIAAKQAGQTTAQTRYIFEGFATATSKLSLSATESERVFKALEQMFNKGKVSAEELTQQLGDALPGALNLFAKARGVTTQEFTKLMEQGAIGPEIIVTVAKQLQETYGTINQGTANLSQAQARFENATNNFLNNVAKGGFVQAYQGLLERLTTFMNDGSADKLASALSAGFVLVIDVISKVADNLDLLKIALEAVIAVKIISFLGQLPMLIRAVWTEMVLLNGTFVAGGFVNAASVVNGITTAMGAAGLTGAATRLGPALGIVANGLAAIARWLPVVGAAVVAYQLTRAIVDRMDDNVVQSVKDLTAQSNRAFEDANKALADLEKKRGTEQEAAAREKYEKLKQIAVAGINAQTAAVKAAQAKGIDLSKVNFASTSDKTGGSGATEFPGESDAGPRKLAKLQSELAAEAKKTERGAQNERLKAAKGDLAARLDLIDQEYDARRTQAETDFTDTKQRQEAIAAINKASLSKQAVERAKYNNEQSKKDRTDGVQRVELARQVGEMLRDMQAKLNNDLADQKGTSLPIEDQLKAAEATVDKTFKEIEDKIAKFNKKDPAAAKAATDQVEALKQQAIAISNTNVLRSQANALTDEFTKKQKIMQTNIGAIQTQVDNGQKTIIDGNTEINNQLAQYGPGVQAAGKAALDFAVKFQNMLDPVKFAEIVATVGAGTAKAGVDAQTAANNVVTTQKLLNNLLAAEAREREQINLERSLNMTTSEQEADALNATSVKYAGGIIALTQQLQTFIGVARDANAMSAEQLDAIEASTTNIAIQAGNGKKSLSDLNTTMKDSILTNGTTAFDSMGEALAKVALGQSSISDGFKSMGQAALQFFASFLRDITTAIIKQQILNALTSFMGGGGESATGAMVSTGVFHAGGQVTAAGGRSRQVNPAIFMGAQRFHDGGLPGLKADEVPTILQKGEEVLTKNDARNAMNGGLSGGGGGQDAGGTRIVLVDDRSRVPEAMAGSEGRKVIIDQIKANVPTIKTMLGIRG